MNVSNAPANLQQPGLLAEDAVPTEEGVNVDQRDVEGEQLIRELPPLPEPDGRPHRPATNSP